MDVPSETAIGDRGAPARFAPNGITTPIGSLNRVAPADAVRQTAHEERTSDAEKITGLQQAIEADQRALQAIEADLANPHSEYHQAEAEFKQLNELLEKLKRDLQGSQDASDEDAIAKLTSEIDKQQAPWKLAKERFELVIQERKTIQEKAATLRQKIQQEQQPLDKLSGTVVPPAMTEAGSPEPPPSAPAAIAPPGTIATAPSAPSPAPASLPPTPPAASAAAPAPAAPAQAGTTAPPVATTAPVPAAAATPDAATATAGLAPPAEKPANKELVKATEEAQKKEAAAREAEQEVQSVVERMDLLRKDLQLERQLLATASKKADIALETERQLQEDYGNKLSEGAEIAVCEELRLKLSQARQRFTDARGEARERVNRIDQLQARYATLQSEQIIALQEAEGKRLEADSAQQTVATLRNPFTARNILQWLLDNGPRIVVILVTMLMTLWMSRITKHRLIEVMAKRGGLGKRADRENRARTLVGVFENAARVAIVSGGGLMILDAIGAPIATLMGGAAVFGLAIAFGAQSLIRDYFYGFMILLEQQYTINDVIKIGDIAGQVERITLRMTMLRDLEGRVHFIPHGTITSTTNMTHGWSRALFEIGVAYKEDADRVIELIMQLGQQLRRDPQFGSVILEDLTMLGVDALGDSAVMLKFFIKTQPLKQWDVKREFLRRIKRTFDEQGIEIPFPHRTVYHRHVEAEDLEVASRDAAPRRKSA